MSMLAALPIMAQSANIKTTIEMITEFYKNPANPDDFEIPNILSNADFERYSLIFALQENGKWNEANQKIKELDNNILMGEIEFQRYMHPTKYRSSFKELSRWLEHYHDHPGARQVYRLARKRQPAGAKRPQKPKAPTLPASIYSIEKTYKKTNLTKPQHFNRKTRN
ncbi:MAG: hypothetical protein AAF403_09245 [Pseudomonadota bacterium]